VVPTIINRREFDYTPWESQYMWDEGFAPIIDESNRVVAHVGYVYISDIWISLEDRRALGKPDREPPKLIGWDEEQAYTELASQLNKDIESGVRVYVDDGKKIDKNRFIIWSHDTMPNYGRTATAVIVNPNGQIIKILEVTHIKISRWQRALTGLITALDVLFVIDLAGLVIELALIPVARIGALGLESGGRRIRGLVLRTLRREGKVASPTRMMIGGMMTDAQIQQFIDMEFIRRFSTRGVPQLPPTSRTPTFANQLKAVQKARDLSIAAGNIDEFGVIINTDNELIIGKGGPVGIVFPKKAKVVGHSHAPGTPGMQISRIRLTDKRGQAYEVEVPVDGPSVPSPQDIATLPSDGSSEFFIDPKGRIHIIGKPTP
jgi:hypothetical protein